MPVKSPNGRLCFTGGEKPQELRKDTLKFLLMKKAWKFFLETHCAWYFTQAWDQSLYFKGHKANNLKTSMELHVYLLAPRCFNISLLYFNQNWKQFWEEPSGSSDILSDGSKYSLLESFTVYVTEWDSYKSAVDPLCRISKKKLKFSTLASFLICQCGGVFCFLLFCFVSGLCCVNTLSGEMGTNLYSHWIENWQ